MLAVHAALVYLNNVSTDTIFLVPVEYGIFQRVLYTETKPSMLFYKIKHVKIF